MHADVQIHKRPWYPQPMHQVAVTLLPTGGTGCFALFDTNSNALAAVNHLQVNSLSALAV